MREWCSCGCSIRARRKDVLEWRTSHRHDSKPEEEPDKQGSMAMLEHAGRRYFESEGSELGCVQTPIIQARIGFQPNA